MTDINKWYAKMALLISGYLKMADDHWNSRLSHNSLAYIHTKPDPRNHHQLLPDPESERKALMDLWEAYATKPPQKGTQPRAVKREMYHLLGLWMCSYFLGIVHPDCWERVVVLANKLRTYPGGPFYSKLSGDIYRYERRRRQKIRPMPTSGGSPPSAPLLVMAFDPIILIPLRDNTLSPLDDGEKVLEMETTFRRQVGQLASRYLRLEAWLYWSDPNNPIVYLVSQEQASKALKSWNDTLTDVELQGESLTYLLQILHMLEPPHEPRPHQEIWIVDPESARLKGLSSCTLGLHDGVLALRPNIPNKPPSFCSWIEDEVLRLERQKLIALHDEIRTKVDSSSFDASDPTQFKWYDPSEWKVRQLGAHDSMVSVAGYGNDI